MEKRISSIREKVKTRPTRFYSSELKKEVLEIRDELAFRGWTKKNDFKLDPGSRDAHHYKV